MEEISLEMIYSELKELKKEIELVRNILVPEEKISKQELKDILKIEKEMERGEKISLEDALKEI
jgi:CRISPR/Cas system-associated protein Csx1